MVTNESAVDYCNVGSLLDTNKILSSKYDKDILRVEAQSIHKHSAPLWASHLTSDSTIIRQDRILVSSIAAFSLVLLLPFATFIIRLRKRQSSLEGKNQLANDDKNCQKRKREFLARVGDDYGYRGSKMGYIDDWRPTEFPTLQLPLGNESLPSSHSDEREVYLDYAGAGLPTKSQLEQICQDSMHLLGNPHSTGPAAARTTQTIQASQPRVLKHLDARPGKFSSLRLPETFYHSATTLSHRQTMDQHPGYDVLFTSGATQAFQKVAERFPFGPQSIFLYVTNSHNSVVGMRQLAMERGAKFHCLDLNELEQMKTIDDWRNLEDRIISRASESTSASKSSKRRHLLVFPSECNFGGDRPDAKSILQVARASGWYTMLDIAKHASTDSVSLNGLNPDFAALSFYKLFGAPTGVGALLVRRTAISVLTEAEHSRRHYQGGGSVDIMLPNTDYTVTRSTGLASLKSGTTHFRGIASLVHGFDVLENLGGMSAIHTHASCLANEMSTLLRNMKHSNGMPVVHLYGAWKEKGNDETRGPTVTLNVFRSDGSSVGYNEVSKLGSLNRPPIQFRTGCFCNPGACQRALDLNDTQAIENYEKNGHVCGDHIDLANGMPTGAVRVSFGKDSIWEDMDAFVQFIKTTFQDNSLVDSDERKSGSLGKDAIGTIDNESSNPMTSVNVSELYLFPIKSCAGQRTAKWPLCLPSGKLKYDREFAIVDTSGAALRMQTCPKLGLISPVIDLGNETMRVSAPGCKDLLVNLSEDLYHGGENAVRVCGNKCNGCVWGDAGVSEWFSSFLGIQCWLARFSSSNVEGLSQNRPGFSNEQPILLVSENAVATLNQVLVGQGQPPCTAKRFRPNIVIKDMVRGNCHHHIEDEWASVTLSGENLTFSVEGGCPRCTMVDFDPTTGQRGKTLRALASYRRRNGHIVFGIFLRAMSTKVRGNEQDSSKKGIAWLREGDLLECN